MRSPLSSIAILGIIGLLTGCDSPLDPDAPLDVRVTPAVVSVGARDSVQLEAVVLNVAGGPNFGARFDWSSSDPQVAAVDPTGLVTGIQPGDVEIQAEHEGKVGRASLTVQPRGYVSFAASGFHTCALTFSSEAYCWGSNSSGKMGNGSSVGVRPVPEAVVGELRFESIMAGRHHTCALTSEGAAHCWGFNRDGQLGVGDTLARTVPTEVAGGLSFSDLSGGSWHTCGLTVEGRVYCWGQNASSQLGLGEGLHGSAQLAPATVATEVRFASIDAGHDTTCGLTAEGVGYCWGRGALGAEGDSLDGDAWISYTPVEIPGVRLSEIRPGGYVRSLEDPPVASFACGLGVGGALYCWQSSDWAGVGVEPVVIAPGPFEAASLFGERVCTLDGTGEVECRSPLAWSQPDLPAGELRFVTLGVGLDHVCGAVENGLAYCWGLSEHGQLGDGVRVHLEPMPPVQVIEPE
ncbi:MAG: Ig-like domain-containing protein [Gemmatimonadota bacterium]